MCDVCVMGWMRVFLPGCYYLSYAQMAISAIFRSSNNFISKHILLANTMSFERLTYVSVVLFGKLFFFLSLSPPFTFKLSSRPS